MMKLRLIILLLAFSVFNPSKSQSLESQSNSEKNPDIPIGKVNRADLQKGEFARYFYTEYCHYQPNHEVLEKLKPGIFNRHLLVVLGTWCQDSKEQVPHFFKILDQVDYNTKMVEIICVDRKKTAGSIDLTQLNIKRIPTFIVYDGEVESGRIIETPANSIEGDLLNILQSEGSADFGFGN
jgi:hypothetical protein